MPHYFKINDYELFLREKKNKTNIMSKFQDNMWWNIIISSGLATFEPSGATVIEFEKFFDIYEKYGENFCLKLPDNYTQNDLDGLTKILGVELEYFSTRRPSSFMERCRLM